MGENDIGEISTGNISEELDEVQDGRFGGKNQEEDLEAPPHNYKETEDEIERLDEEQIIGELIHSEMPFNETEAIEEERNNHCLKYWEQVFALFNLQKLSYSFFVGFLPSVVDIVTDFSFAARLTEEGKDTSAGLAYSIIMAPTCGIVLNNIFGIAARKQGSRVLIFVTIYGGIICTIAAIFLVFNFSPLALFYPAFISAVFITTVKGGAVLIHTKAMQKWSVIVSAAEGTFESAFQFLFMFHIWLNGGRRETLAMCSSLFMIAKSRVENYLENQVNTTKLCVLRTL